MQDAQQVAAMFVEAFNRHDEARMRELNAADAVLEAPGDVRLQGADAAAQYAMGWLRAFPDGGMTVRHEHCAGDVVVQEFAFEGNHESPLAGPGGEIPPTHRHLTGRGVQILAISDGKIVETRLYFDQVQIFTQLGVMSELAAA